jgi:hypothetical protein
MPRRPEGIDEAEFERRRNYRDVGRRRPDELELPDGLNSQLHRLSQLAGRRGSARGRLLDPDVWSGVKGRLDRRVGLELGRLDRLASDLFGIFDSKRENLTELNGALGSRLDRERGILGKLKHELGDWWENTLVSIGGEDLMHLWSKQQDLLSMLKRELAFVQRFVSKLGQTVSDVVGLINTFQTLVTNPEQILGEILGPELSNVLGVGNTPPMGHGPPGHAPPAHPPAHPPPAHPPPDHPPPGHTPPHGQAGSAHPRAVQKKPDHLAPVEKSPGHSKAASAHPRAVQQKPGHLGTVQKSAGPSGHSQAASAHPRAVQGRPDHLSPVHQAPAHSPPDHPPAPHDSPAPQGAPAASDAVAAAKGEGLPPQAAPNTGGSGPDGGAVAGALGGAAAVAGVAGVAVYAGEGFARDGGLTASDVSSTVSTDEPTFLMSPGEGQLMTVPGESAQPLDQGVLSRSMVDAQMDGQPVSQALASTLDGMGYTVYQRPWGDWTGALVRFGSAAAGA